MAKSLHADVVSKSSIISHKTHNKALF